MKMRTVCALIVIAPILLATSMVAAVDVKKIDASVVRVLTRATLLVTTSDGRVVQKKIGGTGTGFVVNKSMVVTNRHVVYPDKPGRGQRKVEILKARVAVLVPGIKDPIAAEVIQSDAGFDLAVLRIEGLKTPILPIARTAPDKGQKVFSLGFPGLADVGKGLSRESTLSSGVVEKMETLAKIASGPKILWVQHSATVRRGNSGGPLFNDCGEVVGVNTLVVGGDILPGGAKGKVVDASLSFASHASVLASFLKQHDLPFTATDTPCRVTAPAAAAAATEWLTPANMVAIAASLFALVVALRNRRRIAGAARSISHVVSRPPPRPKNPPARPQPEPQPDPEPTPAVSKGWVVAGSDGRGRAVRFTISADDFAKAGGNLVIGRDGNIADLVIADDTVSSRHVRFELVDGGILVEDLGSSNGSQLGGATLDAHQPRQFAMGATLALGGTRLSLQTSG